MKSSVLIVITILLFMCFTACGQKGQSQIIQVHDDMNDAFGL